MTIWFATGNTHKKAELAAILRAAILRDHEIHIPADAGINFDPEETGSTFLENALIKARALYRLTAESGQPGKGLSSPVIADDSGLCVDALGGRPGIYSARYQGIGRYGSEGGNLVGGKKPDAAERNALLLDELGDKTNRKARFVCAMVLLFSEDRFFVAQETLEGEIISRAEGKRGSGGFGYDPILWLPEFGRTVAELSEEEKNRISHRGKAAKALAKLLGE
ncbi:non-canonical purine NTP pyrophosphatase [Spirochaetia bacterium]|nr:non-canonical purine NTP pyrophosphatase [Spirochaetia bacterium]